MYKIYNDLVQYEIDIEFINNKTKELFNGLIYSDKQFDSLNKLAAINLSLCNGVIINEISNKYPNVITQKWLTTDIVDILPNSFFWHDSERNNRLICVTSKILENISIKSELGQMLISFIDDFKEQTFVVGEITYIYLSTIEGYKGVSCEWLISNWPEIFLNVESK